MRVRGERSDGDDVVEAGLVQRVVVHPHALQVQVDGGEFQARVFYNVISCYFI